MILKAPSYLNSLMLEKVKDNSIFLAGSITGAHDWQQKVEEELGDYFDLIVNPRRENYNALDPKVEVEQITWEHHHIAKVKYILFYFSYETLAPITLFEYGIILKSLQHGENKKVFVCVHPKYKRKRDVEIQTSLYAPEKSGIMIYNDLNPLIFYIKNFRIHKL